MGKLTKTLTVTTAMMAIGGAVVATAPSASAAPARNGKCETGEFCYYFNSGAKGSVSDFTKSVANYANKQPSCYDFKGAGAGKGKCIKNEAASVWNRSTKTVRVYFNSNYSGKYQDFKPGAKANLNASLKNQNASHQFSPSSSSKRVNMSYALYKANGGRITCFFDGYTSTAGRHEGIDLARSVGSKVHSLTSGKVTSVVRGANGRSSLSTIAVYNASLKKTVIYLHTAPRSSLRVGQNVKRGQLIATEGWRGVSYKSSAHTHVEVRPGKHKTASKSVGDPVLNNPNPNSFWISQNYNLK